MHWSRSPTPDGLATSLDKRHPEFHCEIRSQPNLPWCLKFLRPTNQLTDQLTNRLTDPLFVNVDKPRRRGKTHTSMNIRTPGCLARNSGAKWVPENVDFRMALHPSVPRTPFSCTIVSICPRPHRFAPLDVKNARLKRKKNLKSSTSRRIRTLGCPECRWGLKSHLQLVDVKEDLHPWIPRAPFDAIVSPLALAKIPAQLRRHPQDLATARLQGVRCLNSEVG